MDPNHIAVALFWVSCGVLFYTFAGYPAGVFVLGRVWRREPARGSQGAPAQPAQLSVVVVARNEEARIAARLRNLLASDYPAECLEIIVVSDGSTDGTESAARALGDSRIRLIVQSARQGKASGLNTALAAARGDIIVFADARQQFATDALRQLASNFSDPAVGAVSGDYATETAASNIGGGVDAYWRLEKLIRRSESLIDSSIGCTGAIYAIRRRLFQPLPADTVLDDVVIPMCVAGQGSRVVFDPAARCFDPQANDPGRDTLRKQRTLAGNFQMLCRYPAWLLPWRNRLWWQLISHKYLRLAAPALLPAMLAGNVLLVGAPFYDAMLAGQIAFYTAALAGFLLPSVKARVLTWPAGFCFLNLMTVRGFFSYVSGRYRGGQW